MTDSELWARVEIIRSSRKTVGIQIKDGGRIVVRSPLHLSRRKLYDIIISDKERIENMLSRAENLTGSVTPLTESEMRALKFEAKKYLTERAEHYASVIGVKYGKISFRWQKTRWGSCSSKGNLNFNCLLMLAPREVADSVVVHELCHIKQANHSKKFYAEVYRAFPNYSECHKWLVKNGALLMARIK